MHGIDIYGLLADSMGKSTSQIQDMVSKGQIGYKEITDALKKASAEGGRFYGAMEKQSHTLNGMISNFKDNLGNLTGSLSMGFTNALKEVLPSINKIIDRINDLLGNNTRFQAFSDTLVNVFGQVARVLDSLSDDQLNAIIDFLVAMAKTGPLLLVVGGILPKLASGFSLLGGGIGGVSSLLGGLLSSINPVLGIVVNALGTMGQSVVAFIGIFTGITAIVGVLGFVNEQMDGQLEDMAFMFFLKAPQIVENFVMSFVEQMPKIISQGQQIITYLVSGLEEMLPNIMWAVETIFKAISSTMTNNGPQIAYFVTNGLMNLVTTIIKYAPQFLKGTLQIIKRSNACDKR